MVKLALRLVMNHRVNWIRALELAEKGVERVEKHVKRGNPSDYTQSCTQGNCVAAADTCTEVFEDCRTSRNCIGGACGAVSGSCTCPSPLANSHEVSGCTQSCVVVGTCARCVGGMCIPSCAAVTCAIGSCGYDCDEGYEWDGENCVSIVAVKQPVGDGLTFAI